MHMTEMMTDDWLAITAYVLVHLFSCCNYKFIVSIVFSHGVYFRCQKFSFQTHMVQKTGSMRKWSRFMAPFSGACAMGISYITVVQQ